MYVHTVIIKKFYLTANKEDTWIGIFKCAISLIDAILENITFICTLAAYKEI